MEYLYLGDRNTRPDVKKQYCKAVKRNDKCVRGKNGSMLVVFADGKIQVITARLLRKLHERSIII